MTIRQAIATMFAELAFLFEDPMEDFSRFYTYKGKIYYSWGEAKSDLKKVKDPQTGEWFDAVSYSEVQFFTMDGDESGTKYYRTHGGPTYYREVEDFKKKFKKCKKSQTANLKEIW